MESSVIERRKRKFLLAAPLFILPFVILLFYSFGGGRGPRHQAKTDSARGLNTSLPSPQLADESGMDKLSLYRKAEKDSLNRLHAAKEDPVIDLDSSGRLTASPAAGPGGTERKVAGPHSVAAIGTSDYRPVKETKEQQITNKLSQLQKLLDTKTPDTILPKLARPPVDTAATHRRIAQLESLLQNQIPQQAEVDPQLRQMEGMLDKILDIQHPDRMKDQLRQQSVEHKGKVFAVIADPNEDLSDLLQSSGGSQSDALTQDSLKIISSGQSETGRFYELETPAANGPSTNTIAAVIHEDATVVSGASVKIRLQQDMYVQGQLIPKGSFVFGKCSLSGDRLQINVTAIPYQGTFYSVALTVYDSFGMAGIPIDASQNQQAAQEGTQQAIEALSIGAMDPSVGAQAASAGIEAAKHLISKKVKTVKINLKANFPILLVNTKDLNS
jgi:conjugative transposon TraM protein